MPVDSHDNQCRMGYTVREDMWTDMIHDVACTLGSQNVNPADKIYCYLSFSSKVSYNALSSAIIALVRQMHHTIKNNICMISNFRRLNRSHCHSHNTCYFFLLFGFDPCHCLGRKEHKSLSDSGSTQRP